MNEDVFSNGVFVMQGGVIEGTAWMKLQNSMPKREFLLKFSLCFCIFEYAIFKYIYKKDWNSLLFIYFTKCSKTDELFEVHLSFTLNSFNFLFYL